MDTSQQELSLEESLRQVMQTLPPMIHDYLVQGKYTPVARSLMAKYGLRIDQGGVLEREIMLLLMGVESPTEFTEVLAEEAKLSKLVIDSIVQDVNNQIFVPLRKEEEFGNTQFVNSPTPITKLKQAVVLPTPPHIAPLPPKVVMPNHSSETLGDVVRSVLHMPKPEVSINLLEDHEEPHIDFNKPVMPTVRATPPAPVNLQGAMPPQALPTIAKPVFVAPREPSPAPAPLQSYSSDPYREPINEPLSEI